MKTTIRLIAIVITLIVAFSCVVTASARTPMMSWRYGDMNNDGEITTTDARRVLRYSAGMEGAISPYSTADVDADGKVTTTDARLVLQAVAGIRNYSCVGVYQEWVYPVDADYYLKEPKLTWGTIR